MSSQENKKKRKSVGSSSSGVSVTVAEPSGSAGPAFVNFPSVKPNRKTGFTMYSRTPGSSSDISQQKTIVAGETTDVEFFSTNRDHRTSEGTDCAYVAALYDPETKSVHIAPTPLYLLAHRVKRMRAEENKAEPTQTQWKAKRNDLGETFGTRKAKSQIKAEERNKVDVSAMAGVRGSLIQSIGGVAAKDEGPTPPSEFIPTPDLETKVPSEVYPRSAIVPDSEWSAISVTPFVNAADDASRRQLLPYTRSRWIENKLRFAVDGPANKRKESIRMVYYLACLMALNNTAGQLSKTSVKDLPAKFVGVPQVVLNGLMQRFAEPSGKRYTITEKTRTKLMAWICVCYLAIDNWTVDVGTVAKDLQLQPTKITDVYKSLGCSVDLLSPTEREKMGLSKSAASQNRRAVLKAPVKFPKVKKRGPARSG